MLLSQPDTFACAACPAPATRGSGCGEIRVVAALPPRRELHLCALRRCSDSGSAVVVAKREDFLRLTEDQRVAGDGTGRIGEVALP